MMKMEQRLCTCTTDMPYMGTVNIEIDEELINEALKMQRENNEFFDGEISQSDITALINQIIADHLQDIEDARAIQKLKADPNWKRRCVEFNGTSNTEGI